MDQRFRRAAPRTLEPLAFGASTEELEELARRVLGSIDAALVAPDDGGNCLRYVVCENNRLAASAQDGRRIWMPVWR